MCFIINNCFRYLLNILVFDRPIRGCPIPIEVTDHNNPVKIFGSRGSGKDGFLQPVAIAIDRDTEFVSIELIEGNGILNKFGLGLLDWLIVESMTIYRCTLWTRGIPE